MVRQWSVVRAALYGLLFGAFGYFVRQGLSGFEADAVAATARLITNMIGSGAMFAFIAFMRNRLVGATRSPQPNR